MRDEDDEIIEENDFLDDFDDEYEEEIVEIQEDIPEEEIIEENNSELLNNIVDNYGNSNSSNSVEQPLNQVKTPETNQNSIPNKKSSSINNDLKDNEPKKNISNNSIPNNAGKPVNNPLEDASSLGLGKNTPDMANTTGGLENASNAASGASNLAGAAGGGKAAIVDSAIQALEKSKKNQAPQKGKSVSEEEKDPVEEAKEKKEAKKEEEKQDATQALKAGAEIAAGNKVQGIIDLIPLAIKQLKKKIKMWIIATCAAILITIIIICALIAPIQESLEALQEFWDGVKDVAEKTDNLYSGLGFKSTEDAFYEELDNIYNDNFSDINLALIMSALHYSELDNNTSTDYSQTDEGSSDSLFDKIQKTLGTDLTTTDDKYTEGKILRARILADGMVNETEGERVTLEEFSKLYSEQLKNDTVNLGNPFLGLLLSANPVSMFINTLKELDNFVAGPTYTTPGIEATNAFGRLVETESMGLKTLSSIEIEWFKENDNGEFKVAQVYVTMKVKAYDEEIFKQFLATRYIPKMPEFKMYLNDLDGPARDKEIERIVNDIYDRERLYTDIYGDIEGNVENEETVCLGSLDVDVVKDMEKPIKVGDTVSFDGAYAYGINGGTMHSGVDLNEETAGIKEGAEVYAVEPGKVLEVDMSVSCNTKDDSNCSENGSYVALSHDIKINGTSYTFVTLYANLKEGSNTLKVKDKVKKGAKIGEVGTTGHATMPQLHFAFIKGQKLDTGSAIDPTNLFVSCNSAGLVGDSSEEQIWWYLRNEGYSEVSTAAAIGNLRVESGLMPNKLEYASQAYTLLGDEKFTEMVNSGKISKSEFISSTKYAVPKGWHGYNYDGTTYGYGLAQWTAKGRKENLYNASIGIGSTIDDLKSQLDFLVSEFQLWADGKLGNGSTNACYKRWKNGSEESQLSDATEAYRQCFEVGAKDSNRYTYAKEAYDKYHGKTPPTSENLSDSSNISGQTKSKNKTDEQKIKLVFPNGVPTSEKELKKYLIDVEVPITDKNGKKKTTNVTVHKAIAGDVKAALQAAQDEGFRVYQIGGYRPFGSDPAGKVKSVGLIYSQHCYGLAVDINVDENCYKKPPSAACSVGSSYNPGKNKYAITPDGVLYKSFISNGWGWGGDWTSLKDYMHFSYFGT